MERGCDTPGISNTRPNSSAWHCTKDWPPLAHMPVFIMGGWRDVRNPRPHTGKHSDDPLTGYRCKPSSSHLSTAKSLGRAPRPYRRYQYGHLSSWARYKSEPISCPPMSSFCCAPPELTQPAQSLPDFCPTRKSPSHQRSRITFIMSAASSWATDPEFRMSVLASESALSQRAVVEARPLGGYGTVATAR